MWTLGQAAENSGGIKKSSLLLCLQISSQREDAF